MTETDPSLDPSTGATPKKKPCIALMGEFSAGKSTLSNLLIGSQSLPVQVTATQLPPVWISKGDQPPYRVDTEGNIQPVDLNRIDDISVDDTAYVRIYRQADVLDGCDIIDMPGISDPSMAADVWQRVIHNADAVIWCTHATQAWRQSEAAVWDSLPHDLHENSMLLLTRMDKINSEKDRVRLLRRVMHETQGLFSDVLPISLLQAINAGENADAWEASGARAFSEKLSEIVQRFGGAPKASAKGPDVTLAASNDSVADGAGDAARPAGSVMPTRISPRVGVRPTSRRRERPSAHSAHAS
ncbi:MAG: dynamin family protein [Pseudomonadota bacterium]